MSQNEYLVQTSLNLSKIYNIILLGKWMCIISTKNNNSNNNNNNSNNICVIFLSVQEKI